MARKATIQGVIHDYWGDAWEWSIAEPAGDVVAYKGWPAGQPRGAGGCGGPRWIVTPDIAAIYLAADRPNTFWPAMRNGNLPWGPNTLKKHRRLLGIDRVSVAEKWWHDRFQDLHDMPIEAFATKHGVSGASVSNWRERLGVENKDRQDRWWLKPDAREILTSDRPASWIAEQFGISVAWAHNLRYMLRKSGVPINDLRGRKLNEQSHG